MKYVKYTKYIMSFGHFCSDFTQGTLSAILPFLIAAYNYNYTTAAVLVMVSNIVGSIIQPIFGYLADKLDKPSFMIAGVLLAGGGMSVTGLIPNYVGLCIAVVISGIGVAMFHPQGAQMVNRSADESNIGMGLGIFSFGGNAGFTLGPIIATGAITLFGLKGTLFFLVPSLIFAVVTTFFYKGYTAAANGSGESADDKSYPESGNDTLSTAANNPNQWSAFIKLSIAVISRSVMFAGISTFLILYYIEKYALSEATGSIFLSIFFAVSAVAALIGGKMADSLGSRKTLLISFGILFPAALIFALSHNLLLSVVMLLPMALGISICYSPMVALGQRFLPNHVGFASGVTLGFSVSVGGIVSPLLGKIGDLYGLTWVFYIVAGLAVIPIIISLVLPKEAESY